MQRNGVQFAWYLNVDAGRQIMTIYFGVAVEFLAVFYKKLTTGNAFDNKNILIQIWIF